MTDRLADSASRATVPRTPASSASTTERPRAIPTGRDGQRSILAEGLVGSPILKIAAEVREMQARGEQVCNLTVGDFAPSEFRVPDSLTRAITAAVEKGETNYPPSTGVPALRAAINAFCQRRLGIAPESDGLVIAAGARPLIYGVYRILVDPGDKVVFPVPSWNNGYYCQLSGGVPVPIPCEAKTGFLPTAAMLRGLLSDARLLVINSPVNPTGTVISAAQLTEICDAVLEENARRAGRARPLYLMYDQVYWMLTFGAAHVHPVALRPAMAAYTVYVDGISKSFAATGLRVGWGVGPAAVMRPMSDLLTHVGAWAPRPEQVATSSLLGDDAAIDEYHAHMRPEVLKRLQGLHDGIVALKARGFAVDAAIPGGAIYLSARFALHGKRAGGVTLRSDDDVRAWLLRSAGLAAVPFSAFGDAEGSGWFRLSVGAVSMAAIDALLPRLRSALETLE